jgi:hypothetical protein
VECQKSGVAGVQELQNRTPNLNSRFRTDSSTSPGYMRPLRGVFLLNSCNSCKLLTDLCPCRENRFCDTRSSANPAFHA